MDTATGRSRSPHVVRISRLLGLLAAFLSLALTPPLLAVVKDDHPKNDPPRARGRAQTPTSKHAPGQLIVKYKHSVTECVHCLLQSKKASRLATMDASDSLDQLHTKHRVTKATPVFRTEADETALKGAKTLGALRAHHAAKVTAIQQKFPQRTRRAPKDAVLPDLSHVYLLEVPPETDIEAAVAEFATDPHIEYAHPNYLAETLFIPNDPYYSSSNSWGQGYDDLWGLKKLQTEPAWDLSQGQGVVVAVVDTGADATHPDLAVNMWKNPGEIPGNGLDDDANGFIDDVRGRDFVNGDSNPSDDNGHGTHVSGTIAAVGQNGLGVIGVAPQATIMAVKVFDSSGSGWDDQIASGLRYAVDNGADVINNSWGCGFCPSMPILEDAVRYAHGLGAVLVFAAGNSSDDVSIRSPQNMTNPKPIVVSATDQFDAPTFFTSYGALVDVAAPGGGVEADVDNILSLKAAACDPVYLCSPELIVGTNYLRLAGTSMATPHAAGVAALVLARHPAFTNEEVRQVLQVSADDVGPTGADLYTGAGRLNAAEAVRIESVLTATISAPSPGTNLGSSQAIKIIGTAVGPGFVRYDLSYGVGASPTTWTPISSATTPVTDGLLGTWNVETLGINVYLLRLSATDAAGQTFTALSSVFKDASTPLITDPNPQHYPEISGDRVIWQDCEIGDEAWADCNLALYDLATHTRRVVASHLGNRAKPIMAIDGDLIAYAIQRDSSIHLFDLATNAERRLTNDGYIPTVSGDKIAWDGPGSDGSYSIHFCQYNPLTGACPAQEITNRPGWASMYPSISGDKIVYESFKQNEDYSFSYGLYLYDLTTRTEHLILDDPLIASYLPVVSGNTVVWKTDGPPGVFGIYACEYNPLTGACPAQRITTDEAAVARMFSPAISGNKIVWEDWRNGNADVYLYDLVTQTERAITVGPSNAMTPTILGDTIVWEDDRNGNSDLYFASIVPLSLVSLSASPTPFSPNGDGQKDTTLISASFNHAITSGKLAIKNAAGTVVRSFTYGTQTSINQVWNGKDKAGVKLPDGAYTYVLTGKDGGGSQATGSGTVTLDTLKPVVSGVSDAPDPFQPRTGQTTTIRFTLSESAKVTLTITTSTGTLVRTLLGGLFPRPVGANAVVWNGKNAAGVIVPSGVYTYKLQAVDPAGNKAPLVVGTVTVQ